MPSGVQKGLGYAGAGAGIGNMIVPGIGGIIGGGLGFLGGLFSGSDPEPVYQSPSFADINLQTENPELYAELMRMRAMSDQAEAMYNQRRAGMTYSERHGLEEAMGNQAQQQGNMGLLGSSAGASMQADAEARLRDQIQQRAFQEQQALFQNMAQQRANQANALMQAQNQVMGLKTHAADTNYNQAMQNEQAGNQFYSGLFNGGLGMLGQAQNMNNMKDMYGSLYGNQMPTNIPVGIPTESPNQFAYAPPPMPNYYSGLPQSYNPNVPFWQRPV